MHKLPSLERIYRKHVYRNLLWPFQDAFHFQFCWSGNSSSWSTGRVGRVGFISLSLSTCSMSLICRVEIGQRGKACDIMCQCCSSSNSSIWPNCLLKYQMFHYSCVSLCSLSTPSPLLICDNLLGDILLPLCTHKPCLLFLDRLEYTYLGV